MIAAHDDIRVGDVYVGHQAGHNDWVIKILHVTLRAVRYELVSGPGGSKRSKGNQRGKWLLREIITRSFERIQKGDRPRMAVPTEEAQAAPVLTEEDGGYRTCKSCGERKPTAVFDLSPTRNGEQHLLHTCHQCLVEHRAAGIRAAFARKRAKAAEQIAPPEPRPDPAPEPPPPPQPVPTPERRPLRLQVSPMSTVLLELAAQAEALEERPVRYQELLVAAQGLLEVAESAMGVWVIDDVALGVLVNAVRAAEREG